MHNLRGYVEKQGNIYPTNKDRIFKLMKEKDKLKFAAVMAALSEAFDRPVTAEKIRVYWSFLQDLPIGKIEEAAQIIIATKKISTFSAFPAIAEIREAAHGGDNLQELEALEAWRDAYKNCNMYVTVQAQGIRYEFEKYPPKKIAKAVDTAFGGFHKIINLDPKDELWNQKLFIKVYRLISQQENLKQLPANAMRLLTEGKNG